MKRAIVERRVGGRCYTEQVDGTECDWGTVLAWDPPHRFVMAWQITHDWEYEPDSREVERGRGALHATSAKDCTRVDLEHRLFSRYGAAGEVMRTAVAPRMAGAACSTSSPPKPSGN